MNAKLLAVAFATAVMSFAAAAQARTLDIEIVTGTWTNPVPGTAVSGEGSSRIRWGIPATRYGQSGYDFFTSFPSLAAVEEDAKFNLGTFTHRNLPIFGSSLRSVDLEILIKVNGKDDPITTTFSFAHLETPNGARPCANPVAFNRHGCSDLVTATRNDALSESFEIDGVKYHFDILGFQTHNTVFTEFWTAEKRLNHAKLVGYFRSEELPAVPVPAAVFGLAGGLASLAGLRALRRKPA